MDMAMCDIISSRHPEPIAIGFVSGFSGDCRMLKKIQYDFTSYFFALML